MVQLLGPRNCNFDYKPAADLSHYLGAERTFECCKNCVLKAFQNIHSCCFSALKV